MIFARKVWKLLVAVKDGLALLFLLLFFMMLYAVLTARPSTGIVHDGALLLDLDGIVVEEPSVPDPLTLLLSAEAPVGEFRVHDLVRALRAAAKDDRIKAVVLDLSGFLGGGQVHLQDIGDSIDEVRAVKKPVFAHATAYVDDGLLLAAHADEAWVDPHGGAFVTGPGGKSLYFSKLLEKLNIDAKVYRAGSFKSAAEPWTRSGPSQESLSAQEELYGGLWEAWQADFRKARPKAKLDLVTTDPVAWLEGAGGDPPEAAVQAGLVDRIGDRTKFGDRVAEVAGKAIGSTTPGNYAHTGLDVWLRANPPETSGKAIGVITVAGEMIDGDAGPGVAGGGRIARLLNEALDDDLAALVVRVDSPGGTVIAAEHIRSALLRYRSKKIPIVVSMANMAASGGYWVSMPAERIFAEPATMSGSIGVFAILPTFDRALADLGVTGGGAGTTPLSGQPDVVTGLAPEVGAMLQANVDNTYEEFVTLVSSSRGLSAESVPEWAEGRVWTGKRARELGLVDAYGGLDDALAYAAKRAKLEEGDWHAKFIGRQDSQLSAILGQLSGGSRRLRGTGRDIAGIAAMRQRELIAQARAQVGRLFGASGIQAYCLECPGFSRVVSVRKPVNGAAEGRGLGGLVLNWLSLPNN